MNYKKLSASMAALVEEFQSFGGPALMAAPRAVPVAVLTDEFEAAATPAVFAYVRCDPSAAIDPLPGVNVHSERAPRCSRSKA